MATDPRPKRRTISEEEAARWKYRGRGPRPMTDAEAAEWDRAQREGDRQTILRIKSRCTWGPNDPKRRS